MQLKLDNYLVCNTGRKQPLDSLKTILCIFCLLEFRKIPTLNFLPKSEMYIQWLESYIKVLVDKGHHLW